MQFPVLTWLQVVYPIHLWPGRSCVISIPAVREISISFINRIGVPPGMATWPWSITARRGGMITFVPIVFAGVNILNRHIQRPVETVDIAPTLSAYLGIKPPSGSIGTPLIEVLAK